MIAPATPTPHPLEALQSRVSASRLSCFHQCRLKFFFRYVQKVEKPTTPALHVGTTVHAVLQAWNLARWRREPFQQAKELFDQRWSEQVGIDWESDEEKQRQMAWSLLETCFRESPIPPDERPEAVEVAVEADLKRHGLPELVGVIDLVRAGGRIVDFKTSAQTPNPGRAAHQHEVQTSCYALLYREATGREESGIELHHLVKLKIPKLVVTPLGPMSSEQQTRLFRVMESYLNGLSKEDFVPSPGLHCAACEYFKECRRWC